ncbi:MAG: hypothetical protein QOD93_1719, partial [Acetobacteraceae bacterium]|nr:hypothetical protein [Acetobacteraceae bacterium]
MNPLPHPTDGASYAEAYSLAWTRDPFALLDFFTSDGVYADMAMDASYAGHDEITRFHRWMMKFAPDSVIEFFESAAAGGRLYLDWVWSGSFDGALRLPDGSVVAGSGKRFAVPGVASCRYR